jgi:hypothetical protein
MLSVCKSGSYEHNGAGGDPAPGITAEVVVLDLGIGAPMPGRRETPMTSPTLTRPELTAADRCDRCGAGAQVRAILSTGGELLFCGHHAREYEPKLKEMAAQIQR